MGLRVNGCCCCTLRTAGIIHGWIGIVLFILAIVSTTNRIVNYDPNNMSIDPYTNQPKTLQQEKVTLVLYFVDILISGLLLIGIIKDKHYMLLPWLILRAIGLMVAIPIGILILFFSSFLANPGMVLVSFIFAGIIGLFAWSWVVIYSLYAEIRDKKNRPSPMTMPSMALPYYESQSGPVYPSPPYQEFENKIQSISH